MIRLLFTAIILMSFTVSSFAQETHTLTINFTGMESDKGDLYVALYNKKEDFLKKNFKGDIVKVENKKAVAVFKNLPAGTYAVSAFHDENDNKKMDTKIFGIPKEPIGISNDATGFMGPPKFKKAKFELSEDKTINIKVD